MNATQTINGAKLVIGTALFYVTGNGSCSLNPGGTVSKTLTFRVQSDPGNHAAQIGFPTSGMGPLTFGFGAFASANMQIALTTSAGAPSCFVCCAPTPQSLPMTARPAPLFRIA